MSDLIGDLRGVADISEVRFPTQASLMRSAADEIERLRAALERITTERVRPGCEVSEEYKLGYADAEERVAKIAREALE